MSGGRGLVVALTAVFVGLCSVVGEALMPSAWPPQNWFASLVAIFLIAIPFALGLVVPVFLESTPHSTRWRSFGNRIRRVWRERTLRASALAITLAVIALTMWLTSPIPALEQYVKDDRVGGVDLKQYCKPHGYTSGSENLCSWNIPLDSACDWQYGREHLHFKSVNGPKSGECFTGKEKSVGGISDMQGYCEDRFRRDGEVAATVAHNKNWVCRTPIDKNLACSWLYSKSGLVARKDGPLWSCYE